MRRLRSLPLGVLALAALPPAASAAPPAEVELAPMPRLAVATCLRATGAPGGLAQLGPLRGRTAAVDLLRASATGTERTARVSFGPLADCAAVAEAGDAAVVAGAVLRRGSRRPARLFAAVHDPGGAFGAPVALGDAPQGDAAQAAEVSPTGDAVVAWLQTRFRTSRSDPVPRRVRTRVVAVRRRAREPFGPLQALTGWRRTGRFPQPAQVAAAVDPQGRATVAWARPVPDRDRAPGLFAVETATAEPGAPFGRPQPLAAEVQDADGPALAVAPDGWLLLAYSGGGQVRVLQRRPGEASLSGAATFRRAPQPEGEPAVAVRSGGGGVVAWRRGADADVTASVRRDDGAFGAPRSFGRGPDSAFSGGFFFAFGAPGGRAFPPADQGNGRVRAVVGEDGGALLTWTRRRGRRGDVVDRPVAALGTLDAGFGAEHTLGGPLRSVNGIVPLRLADGRAAIAWTDNLTAGSGVEEPIFTGGGRRHLAVAGAPPTRSAPPPAIRVASGSHRVYGDHRLRLPVRCGAACDVRAVVRRRSRVIAAGDLGLLQGGAGRLVLVPRLLPQGRWRDGRVKVLVRWSAPGARRTATTTATLRLRLKPAPPVPLPTSVTARRRGDRIVVGWRTPFPARRISFSVEARTAPRRRATGFRSLEFVAGRGRTRFRAALRPLRPARIRWVALTAAGQDGQRDRRVLVPVTGG